MLPYSRGLILDNGNNYGIVKTETVFGFRHNRLNDSYNATDPLEWIFGPVNLESPLQESSRALKDNKVKTTQLAKRAKGHKKQSKKNAHRKSKHKKCVFKVFKKNKRGGKFKMHKKYFMPLLLGLLAAKSILVPVALKALAFMSAKGLMMGFFSTVMASVLSLKGMFDTSRRYQDRKDEKTQVEIIQVPTKSEDHYYDDHYKRYDYVPMTPQV